MKKKIKALLLLGLVFLGGCGQASAPSVSSAGTDSQSIDLFAMDTAMTLTAYGDHAGEALDAAKSKIERLDALFSISSESGDIYALNRDHAATLHGDSQTLLERALEVSDSPHGIFDCTIEPVMDAWGFTTENYRIPAEDELSALLKNVDASKIQYDKKTKKITLPKNVKIDFGGIAKGYTSSRIMQIYKKCGVTSGLVSLGGNVQLLGAKPDGSAWKVAVESPDEDGNYLGILQAKDKAVITSGGYERYFEKNGKKYHHIIDPSTGYPAENGLTSVTIISDDGTLADGLSTSLFIMGKEKAEKFWKKYNDKFDVILLTDDEQLYVSEGIADDFQSDYKVNIMKK